MERNGKPPSSEDRRADLEWIGSYLLLLQVIAQTGYEFAGRGAVGVDRVTKIEEYPGHPWNYLPQVVVYEFLDNKTYQMVRAYDPASEMVTVLFKEETTSSYRMSVPYRKDSSRSDS